MVTANLLLSVLFISGVRATCTKQPDLKAELPEKMEALSGSCLQIPCQFSAKQAAEIDNRRNIYGVWIKDDSRFQNNPSNVVYNGSGKATAYNIKLIGNLREKNCTTLFSNVLGNYSKTYYFRIENKPFLATASCDPLRITVEDSPWRPKMEISGDLKEKESVTITCSAFTPCPHSPPQLTWTLQQDSHNYIQENINGTFTTKIQETITLSDNHDGNSITCSAKYPVAEGKDVKTAEETKTLNISYAPKDTQMSISSAGEQVKLTCSSRANPPVSHFIWFRISKDGAMKVSEGKIYIFNLTDGGDYYCVAVNHLGNQTSSRIHLNSSGGSWMAVVGGMIGVLVLISVVALIWWFKSKHSTVQQTLTETFEEPAVQEPARDPHKEDIHYGEISFSKRRTDPSPRAEQNGADQQETLYAAVKVRASNQPVTSFTPATDNGEDLYAQVKRK